MQHFFRPPLLLYWVWMAAVLCCCLFGANCSYTYTHMYGMYTCVCICVCGIYKKRLQLPYFSVMLQLWDNNFRVCIFPCTFCCFVANMQNGNMHFASNLECEKLAICWHFSSQLFTFRLQISAILSQQHTDLLIKWGSDKFIFILYICPYNHIYRLVEKF